jgi:hypothetical protein
LKVVFNGTEAEYREKESSIKHQLKGLKTVRVRPVVTYCVYRLKAGSKISDELWIDLDADDHVTITPSGHRLAVESGVSPSNFSLPAIEQLPFEEVDKVLVLAADCSALEEFLAPFPEGRLIYSAIAQAGEEGGVRQFRRVLEINKLLKESFPLAADKITREQRVLKLIRGSLLWHVSECEDFPEYRKCEKALKAVSELLVKVRI